MNQPSHPATTDALLFSPLDIRGITLRNRIVMSPMCQYSSHDGLANDWHLVHLGTRAVGGAGLIIAEATAVAPEGRISPADLGIWDDAHIEPLQPITEFITDHGAVPGIQIAHAGRKGSAARPWEGGHTLMPADGGWQTVAPSPLPFDQRDLVPKALSIDEIHGVINAFVQAARRALAAGFKVLEIHAAHGYLIHEFLSPVSNHRTDAYGGSFDNRLRLLREIIVGVREIWPEKLPLFLRISATDWLEEGGWNLDHSIELAKIVKPLGVDVIDCSSGGIAPGISVPAGPDYQVPFAEAIRNGSQLMTGAVGLITSPTQAENILQADKADLIFLGRELLRNPYWPLKAAEQLDVDIDYWPEQYLRAK